VQAGKKGNDKRIDGVITFIDEDEVSGLPEK
jgi:hypothetical protein